MAALSTPRSVSMPVSIAHRNRNMGTCNSYDDTRVATSFKQEHQRVREDARFTSETHSHKPMWYFLLSRTGQAAAMRKIAALYKTTPGLTWEEKWVVTEGSLRECRRDQLAGIDEAITHMRRALVYDGDSPLPDLFSGCVTDDDRLDALLARPSPYARMALDTFQRRTASGQSSASSSGTHEAINDIEKSGTRDREKGEELTEATRGARFEDQSRDRYESEDMDEDDPVWEGLVRSCGLNYGTFR
jgi:hypothetical protein